MAYIIICNSEGTASKNGHFVYCIIMLDAGEKYTHACIYCGSKSYTYRGSKSYNYLIVEVSTFSKKY